VHGDTEHAIDLWRQSILRSSESRLYGDVLAGRRAVNAAILEQPVPRFSELGYPVPLPNSARLLAADQVAELRALRAVHAGSLPDAFGATRRYQWESRLSGHLSDERDAMKLFGDVLLAAARRRSGTRSGSTPPAPPPRPPRTSDPSRPPARPTPRTRPGPPRTRCTWPHRRCAAGCCARPRNPMTAPPAPPTAAFPASPPPATACAVPPGYCPL
jgi:hypothetical protein